ncbi:MAG: tetratricopeptide repeat protein [Candidatus Zixiibacteriota bacterium]
MRLLWVVLLSAGLVLPMGPNAKAGPTDEAWQAHAKGDYARAWTLSIPPALDGEAGAQHLIGTMLFEGQGTEQDRCLATLWFDKAARRGHVDAQYRLGMAYAWGYGVSRNDHDASVWLTAAAHAGHQIAANHLPRIVGRIPPLRRTSEEERLRELRYPSAAEGDYYPIPISLLDNDKSIARNWFSPCSGPLPDKPPPLRNEEMEGVPSLKPGLELFREGDYFPAFDDLLAGALSSKDEAIDILTMLTATGRVGPADQCRGVLWAQHGKRIPRPTAILAHAYATGWGLKKDPAKAYYWALWVHRKEPSAIDIRQFGHQLTADQRVEIEERVEKPFKELWPDETFIIPEEIRKANPGLMPGLAPCRADQ